MPHAEYFDSYLVLPQVPKCINARKFKEHTLVFIARTGNNEFKWRTRKLKLERFALLGCYAALIVSHRRFGTA